MYILKFVCLFVYIVIVIVALLSLHMSIHTKESIGRFPLSHMFKMFKLELSIE